MKTEKEKDERDRQHKLLETKKYCKADAKHIASTRVILQDDAPCDFA
jgi:hypothetical protein